jgi:membrane protease YdiL (CAAX protease family)
MNGRRGDPSADGADAAPVRWRLLGAIGAVLVVSNIVVNGFLPAAAYVPWNLTIAAIVLVLARRGGLTWADVGLYRPSMTRALKWGAAVAAIVVIVYVVAVTLPLTKELFVDARAGDDSVADLLYHAVIQIPLGTVVLEEVAFRGVLPAVLGLRGVATWRWLPIVGASVLFGLWHVLPSLDLVAANAGVEDALGDSRVLTVILAVVGTTVAGVVLCRLRWLGRGLLTPVIVHLATNSTGFTIAWFIAR